MTSHPPIPFSRRTFLRTLALAGGAAMLGLPEWVGARPGSPAAASGTVMEHADHARDWAWLVGNWDVWHRQLKERLVGDTHWPTAAVATLRA